ncbi:hypothetical protein [Methylocaldum sp.]|uniref:hypothetical protein n=1 Tax=Methylocaldum sp. TaxID=1969727 RepID=UPI002D678781|nr:hypothetical protein [Methylocaldum sp.]HYE36735.1 hypothetical protein [Methylocaldum sp.]
MIEMQRRMLYTPIFHIDTNLINARGSIPAMNQIEKWAADEIILVNMSGVSFKEALAGNNPIRTKKTFAQLFTLTDENIDITCQRYREIENAIFPGGAKNQNQHNDVKVVYEAAHWNAILVTRDGASNNQPGGILGNRDKLRGLVRIMSGLTQDAFLAKDF